MSTVCPADQCTGCRACEAICPKKAIRLVDSVDKVYAEINEELCVHCGMCERVCPNHNLVQKNEPIEWHQGWANDAEIRKTSSSGGIAAALTRSFIESGGYVCSCYFGKGEFSFHITNNVEEACRFAGSKYVKTNPFNAYNDVSKLLPCLIAVTEAPFPRWHTMTFASFLSFPNLIASRLTNIWLVPWNP